MPEQLVRLSDGEAAWGPQVLPGGDAILFTLVNAPRGVDFRDWTESRIVVQSFVTNERTTLIEDAGDARYLPSGTSGVRRVRFAVRRAV